MNNDCQQPDARPTLKNVVLRVFEKDNLLKPSVLSILAANLFPIIGVLFLGWDVFLILVLFWMENLVIGFYTVLKMLYISPEKAGWGAKISMAVFFCVHYGMFTLVHGIFVFVLFGGEFFTGPASPEAALNWQKILELGWGALTLLISHGVSFVNNYIQGGEYKERTPQDVMMQPYGRVVVLHITIIFGGILTMLLGSPAGGLILLVVLKTIIDVATHLREHRKPCPAA